MNMLKDQLLSTNARSIKILFISDNFPPEVNAPATRTFEHCKSWVEQGAKVTVITGAPNFPHGKVYKGHKNRLYHKEMMSGIEVIRVWTYIAPNQGKIRRVVDYVSFAFSSLIAGLFRDFDIVIGTSPQFFTTWSACGLSKIKGKPWTFELRDLWPDSIKTVGAMSAGKSTDFLHWMELRLYNSADRVVPVTNAFKTNLVNRGVDGSKIDVVTNGANLELYTPREKDERLLKMLGLKNKFIIGYIGTHGMAHSLDFIVRTISKVVDPEIHFLFVGNGAKKKEIVALAQELDLKNVTFYNSVSKEKVPSYLSIIDVSLAPLKRSETFKTVIPSKIFEASAMHKPTLLGVQGQAQEIIEHYDAGLCFEPENEDDLINKIHLIKNDHQLYKRLQKGCDVLAKEYDREKLALKMLSIIKQTAFAKADERRVNTSDRRKGMRRTLTASASHDFTERRKSERRVYDRRALIGSNEHMIVRAGIHPVACAPKYSVSSG